MRALLAVYEFRGFEVIRIGYVICHVDKISQTGITNFSIIRFI